MKKFFMRANYLALFKRMSISIATKKEIQINESNIAFHLRFQARK
jgi:hypothetical protein